MSHNELSHIIPWLKLFSLCLQRMTSPLAWPASSTELRPFPNLIWSQALILCTVAISMPPVRFLQREEEAFPSPWLSPTAWNAFIGRFLLQLQRHLFREAFPDHDPSVSSLFSQNVRALLHCAHLSESVVIYFLISLFSIFTTLNSTL